MPNVELLADANALLRQCEKAARDAERHMRNSGVTIADVENVRNKAVASSPFLKENGPKRSLDRILSAVTAEASPSTNSHPAYRLCQCHIEDIHRS